MLLAWKICNGILPNTSTVFECYDKHTNFQVVYVPKMGWSLQCSFNCEMGICSTLWDFHQYLLFNSITSFKIFAGEVRRKRLGLWRLDDWFFNHHDALVHTEWVFAPRPPYLPDLATCFIFLYLRMKKC